MFKRNIDRREPRVRFAAVLTLAIMIGTTSSTVAQGDARSPVARAACAPPCAPISDVVHHEQRDLLLFAADLRQGTIIEQALLGAIEIGTLRLAVDRLGDAYRRVHVVSGAGATRQAFADRLDEITADAAVRAVDVIFVAHGAPKGVVFSDGPAAIGDVRDDLRLRFATAPARRAKLRMLLSTACYGAAHRAAWRAAGFRVVAGTRGMGSASVNGYLAFLEAWAAGGDFNSAIRAANATVPATIWDDMARVWLRWVGDARWAEVDSGRDISGRSSVTIASLPWAG